MEDNYMMLCHFKEKVQERHTLFHLMCTQAYIYLFLICKMCVMFDAWSIYVLVCCHDDNLSSGWTFHRQYETFRKAPLCPPTLESATK